jgi:uncharacterized protein YcbK (DUF882 family)
MFKDSEIACKCGCGYIVRNKKQCELMDDIFDMCQAEYNKRPVVTSWCRCENHNASVGGVPNSFHVQGKATDWYVPGVDIEDLAEIAEACGADGIGRYFESGFCHADTRGSYATWDE